MEDISKTQIARLVLGYLKNEKYKIAYNYFYKQCPYLDKYRQKNYKICTRHNGLTLEDILLQYSEVFSIVQARLEETDYYSDRSHHFTELPQQIIYLLDDHAKNKSRSSTPVTTTSPCTPNDAHSDLVNSLSSIEKSAHSEVNTTPLKTLPGNANDNDSNVEQAASRKANVSTEPTSRPQRNSHTSTTNTETEHEPDESSSGEGDKSKCIEDAVKAFTASILADEQLQQKIAHTINEARHSDGKESSNSVDSDALDSAMKAFLGKTQCDSAFDSIIDDILGTSLQGDKLPSKSHPSTSAASADLLPNDVPPSMPIRNTSHSGDIIVIDSASFVSQQSMLLNGSMGSNLLMIKQTTPTNASAASDSGKVFYISTPQVLSMNQQGQSQYVMQSGLTEQDIMSMPTVIVCENQLDEKTMVEQATQVPEKRLKTMLPVKRPGDARAETLTDYITLYKCNDTTTEEECAIDKNLTAMHIDEQQTAQAVATIAEPVADIIESSAVVDDTKTPEQSKVVKVPAPTPRSGNRSSHVRALDFKFQTPAKGQTGGTSPKSSKGKKTPKTSQKSLFVATNSTSSGENKKGTKSSSEPWDMKFRSLLSSEPVFSTQKLPAKQKVDNKEVETTSSPNENFDSNNSTKDNKGSASKKKRKGKAKKSKTPVKITKTMKTNETTPASSAKPKSKLPQPQEIAHQIIETTKDEDPSTIKLININKKPCYKRKCNLDSRREVAIAVPKEPRVIELIGESDRLVLSPSKLNGNKRSFVELEGPSSITTKPPHAESNSVALTPDCVPEGTFMPPSAAKRNITPMLETPMKDYPKTPSFFSPANVHDTPFTKVFKEQMDGVDIASIPTPKLLLTPSFPFTPLIEQQSPASNRPTDYSTSSSYYQPSDTEQNKSLEMLIAEECKRQLPTSPSKPALVPSVSGGDETVAVNLVNREKIKKISSHMIARKNLNLMKNKDESCSSSSSSGSSSDSTSDESSETENESTGNETVLQCSSRDSSRYELRSSKQAACTPATSTTPPATSSAPVAVITEKSSDEKNDDINNIVNNVDFEPKLINEVASDDKEFNFTTCKKSKLLMDLEEKRKRTIAMMKNDESEKEKPKKPAPKQLPKKKKTNTSATTNTHESSTKRTLRSNSIKSKDSEVHLSSDDETENEVGDNVPPLKMDDVIIAVTVESDEKKTDNLIETETEKTVTVENDDCKKVEPEEKSVSTKKAVPLVVPIKKRAIVVKKAPAKKTVKKSASETTITKPITTKAKKKSETQTQTKTKSKENPPVAQDVSESIPKPEPIVQSEQQTTASSVVSSGPSQTVSRTSEPEPEQDAHEKKLQSKGSTGREAETMLVVLKERGIHLMPNPKTGDTTDVMMAANAPDDLEDGEIVSDHSNEEDIVIVDLQPMQPILTQSEEKLGRCITTMHTPEDEMMFFDVENFSECIDMVYTGENHDRVRDIEADRFLLTKAVSMTVYDDINDGEKEMKITTTPFDCIFEYPSRLNMLVPKRKKIQVLHNVLIKKDTREAKASTPLSKLYESLVSETVEPNAHKNVSHMQLPSNSPLEDLYKTETSCGKRFKKTNVGKSIERNEVSKEPKATQSRRQDAPSATKPDVAKQDKKRKADSNGDDIDGNKKSKIEDCQRWLKNVDVENVLDKLYE